MPAGTISGEGRHDPFGPAPDGIPIRVSITIDPEAASGADIPIEHRAPAEVLGDHSPADFGVYNPAFDVTPAANISAIITEHGVLRPPYQLAG